MSFARPAGPGAKPADLRFSFELFPPKSDKAALALEDATAMLARLGPDFMTVTFGAGGGTRDRTLATACSIQARTGVPTACHLTCVGASRGEIDALAEEFWDAGIRHIVALRGDPPRAADGGFARYQPHPDGYAYAADLVAGLKKLRPFEISVACYPERHPEAVSDDSDLDHLKRKLDAGADRAITQFFFDPEAYLRFRDRAAAAGIGKPIYPGILPISNFDKTKGFAAACGASFPLWMQSMFAAVEDDPDSRRLVAATVAAEQCRILLSHGVTDFHIYTLNQTRLAAAVLSRLGVEANGQPLAANG